MELLCGARGGQWGPVHSRAQRGFVQTQRGKHTIWTLPSMPFSPLHRCLCPLGPSPPSQAQTMGTTTTGMAREQVSPLSPVRSKSQQEIHSESSWFSPVSYILVYNKVNNKCTLLFTDVLCIVFIKNMFADLNEVFFFHTKFIQRSSSEACHHSDDFIFLMYNTSKMWYSAHVLTHPVKAIAVLYVTVMPHQIGMH